MAPVDPAVVDRARAKSAEHDAARVVAVATDGAAPIAGELGVLAGPVDGVEHRLLPSDGSGSLRLTAVQAELAAVRTQL